MNEPLWLQTATQVHQLANIANVFSYCKSNDQDRILNEAEQIMSEIKNNIQLLEGTPNETLLTGMYETASKKINFHLKFREYWRQLTITTN